MHRALVATTFKRAANMGYNATLIKDATSSFTDANYDVMLDILPLYAKLLSAAQFYAGGALRRYDGGATSADTSKSFTGRVAWLRQ